ncbi:hypothetical protein FRC10_000824 [Ceratobasidium sp. 414]|nr:hypothetical protein FRC10_000824 [Ceratobasidium sp. 414]
MPCSGHFGPVCRTGTPLQRGTPPSITQRAHWCSVRTRIQMRSMMCYSISHGGHIAARFGCATRHHTAGTLLLGSAHSDR